MFRILVSTARRGLGWVLSCVPKPTEHLHTASWRNPKSFVRYWNDIHAKTRS